MKRFMYRGYLIEMTPGEGEYPNVWAAAVGVGKVSGLSPGVTAHKDVVLQSACRLIDDLIANSPHELTEESV